VAFGTNARGVPAIQPPGAALSCVVSPTCDDAPRAGVSRFAPAGACTMTAPITSSMAEERTSRAGSLAYPASTDNTGTKAGTPSSGSAKRPSLAALIQLQRCCGTRSWRRATPAITAPGAIASATIRPFSSSLHRRQRTTPVTSARRRTIFVSSLMSTIMSTRSAIQIESRSCTPAHSAMWEIPLTIVGVGIEVVADPFRELGISPHVSDPAARSSAYPRGHRAGQRDRTVLVNAWTAPKTQQAGDRRPQPCRSLCIHLLCVPTRMGSKFGAAKRYNSRFYCTILPFATATRSAFPKFESYQAALSSL
jgi:hypothetical protein